MQGSDTFNLGQGIASSTLDIFEELEKVMNVQLSHSFGPPRQGDLRRIYLNIDKAKNVLGWEPKYTLFDGLALTVDYFRKLK